MKTLFSKYSDLNLLKIVSYGQKKKIKYYFFSVFALALLFSCECEDLEPIPEVVPEAPGGILSIISPQASAAADGEYRLDSMSRLNFQIEFNKVVDINTVVEGETFFVRQAGSGAFIPGAISWNDEQKILYFKSTENVNVGCSFDPACVLEISLIGTEAGRGVVLDVDGLALDGDQNGKPGGDFHTKMTVPYAEALQVVRVWPEAPEVAFNDFVYTYFDDSLGVLGHSFIVWLEFNYPPDPSSIINGRTFILEAEGTSDPLSGGFFWETPSMIALEVKTTSCPGSEIKLRLIGDDLGDGAIRDQNQIQLDGDDDDLPGGNFAHTFRIAPPESLKLNSICYLGETGFSPGVASFCPSDFTGSDTLEIIDYNVTTQILFSAAVDITTVVPGETLLLYKNGLPFNISPADLIWSNDYRELRLKMMTEDANWQLVLIGIDQGNGAVRDLCGRDLQENATTNFGIFYTS